MLCFSNTASLSYPPVYRVQGTHMLLSIIAARRPISYEAVHAVFSEAIERIPSLMGHSDHPLEPAGLRFHNHGLIMKVLPVRNFRPDHEILYTTAVIAMSGLLDMLHQYGCHEVWCGIHLLDVRRGKPDGLISISSTERSENKGKVIGDS